MSELVVGWMNDSDAGLSKDSTEIRCPVLISSVDCDDVSLLDMLLVPLVGFW